MSTATACKCCKGTGIQKLTIHSESGIEKSDIDCVWCEGIGQVSAQEAADLQAYSALWCECKDSEDSYYVDDNVSDACAKHHWVCNVCKKITQIG